MLFSIQKAKIIKLIFKSSKCEGEYSNDICLLSTILRLLLWCQGKQGEEWTTYLHFLYPLGSTLIFERQTTYTLLQIRLGRISSTCQLCCVHQPQGFEKSAPFSYLSVDGDIAQCVTSVLYRVLYKSATISVKTYLQKGDPCFPGG